MNYSELLKEIRKKFNFTQGEFATECGVAPATIGNIENGNREIPKNLMKALVEKFNVSADWLLTGEGEMFKDGEPGRPAKSARIPILRQKCSCGPGKDWDSEENIEGWLEPWDAFPRSADGRLFAFRAEGVSMNGAGISSGDILIFDGSRSQEAIDDIYIFSLFGSVYCKLIRFDSIGRKIHILEMPESENPKHARELRTISMDDPAAEDFHIFGRALAWIHENRVIRN